MDEREPGDVAEHRHHGWYCCDEMRRELARRIVDGECCAIVIPDRRNPALNTTWCVTHGVEYDVGHAARGGSTD